MQSKVVSVRGWLSLGVFGYRSPVGVDLHRQRIQESFYIDRRRKGGSEHQQRRIQEKICITGESRQDQLIDEKGSRRRSSSAEDTGELLHRQTNEGDSEYQHQGNQEKICNSGALRQDQLIDEKGPRRRSSWAEDPGELLHRQTKEGRL